MSNERSQGAFITSLELAEIRARDPLSESQLNKMRERRDDLVADPLPLDDFGRGYRNDLSLLIGEVERLRVALADRDQILDETIESFVQAYQSENRIAVAKARDYARILFNEKTS